MSRSRETEVLVDTVDRIGVMIAAVVAAVGITVAAGTVGAFVDQHATIKILAFNILPIGLSLQPEESASAHTQGLHLLRDGLLAVR